MVGVCACAEALEEERGLKCCCACAVVGACAEEEEVLGACAVVCVCAEEGACAVVCVCAEEGACAVVGGVAEVGDDVVAFALGFDRASLQPVVRVCGLLVELPRRQRSHDHSVWFSQELLTVTSEMMKLRISAIILLTMFRGYRAARAVRVTESPFAVPRSTP